MLATACSFSAHAAVLTTNGTLPDSPAGAYSLFNFNVTTAGTTTFSLGGDTDPYVGVFSGTNVLDNTTFIAHDDDSGAGLNSFLSLNPGGRQLHCVDYEPRQFLGPHHKFDSLQPRPHPDELHLDDHR
jgi:hypothetical protein